MSNRLIAGIFIESEPSSLTICLKELRILLSDYRLFARKIAKNDLDSWILINTEVEAVVSQNRDQAMLDLLPSKCCPAFASLK
jgi:hypothetical protein